jgi:hypothetical protein
VNDTIRAHVQGGLWRLPPTAVALARAVAALGDGTRRETAYALAGLDHPNAARAHADLAAAGLFEAEALAFTRAGMAEMTLAGLVPATRSALHRRAARLLDDSGASEEQVAEQVLAAEPGNDARAAGLLLRTGRRAFEAGDVSRARRHLKRALHESQFAPSTELLQTLQLVDGGRWVSA